MTLATQLVSVWYQQPKTRLSRYLFPFSKVYQWAVQLRRMCYQKGWLPVSRFPVPVIIVGNLSVGGTGKTPLVIALALHFKQAGFKPGIVSRGYQAHPPQFPYVVNTNSPVGYAGDEPWCIVNRTGCPMVIDPKRPRAVRTLLDKFECDVVISDDGLQHYSLARDIEILVMDGVRRFGNGLCLPAGPLREPIERANMVDFIVSNGQAQPNEILMQTQIQFIESLTTLSQATVHQFQGKRVHAIAGIGDPERFFQSLAAVGIEVIRHAFPDHHSFQVTDLQFEDALPILMTEKDAVKCRPFATDRCWSVVVSASLPDSFFEQVKRQVQDCARS